MCSNPRGATSHHMEGLQTQEEHVHMKQTDTNTVHSLTFFSGSLAVSSRLFLCPCCPYPASETCGWRDREGLVTVAQQRGVVG